jgi:hypothetical protein
MHRLRTCTTTQTQLRWAHAKARFRLARKPVTRLRPVVTLVCARRCYIESRADERLGKSIVYDTVGAMGWRPDVTHHPIRTVITKVIEDEREWEDGRQVPAARREEDCFVRRRAVDIFVSVLTWTASRTAQSGNTTTLASLATSFRSRYVIFMTSRSHSSSLYIYHLYIHLKQSLSEFEVSSDSFSGGSRRILNALTDVMGEDCWLGISFLAPISKATFLTRSVSS